MRSALAFLTIVWRPATPSPSSLPWFPVIGTLLGLAVGGVWIGADNIWPSVVAVALTLAVDAVLTGGLHWDGLADTGDGLLPALTSERRLEVMADPRIGAFGALTIGVVLLLRYSVLAAGPASVWIIAALWCTSRAGVAALTLFGRYARGEGMASSFRTTPASAQRIGAAVVTIAVAISVPLALLERPGHGAAALGAELAAIGCISWLANRRIGGYTGDVLGAQIVLSETIGLLLWSTRW